VHGLAHITGGGITENLPRILADNFNAEINLNSWQQADVFSWLQAQGNLSDAEMLITFNCGVGMIVCVAQQDEAKTLKLLTEQGEQVFSIGEIVSGAGKAKVDYR
jgi:phosphoribosylformylglycinamidine cyclo-ligase